MKIAFDAKRAYQNGTGLGHYSRTLISSLAGSFPEHEYFLCAPKLTNRYNFTNYNNLHTLVPQGFAARTLKSLWRSSLVKKELVKAGIDIYHGLSHEIPWQIGKTGIRSVVTIHDLIFERNPEQYNWMDVHIYRYKFKYACKYADRIIAISQQTKDDIISYYKVKEEKITVCYQSCNPAFAQKVPVAEQQKIKEMYDLPDRFFLYVGSVIERKNLLNICKALFLLKDKSNIPLVVIGDGGEYKKQVKKYLSDANMEKQVIFLSDTIAAKQSHAFQSAADFPAIYQQSLAMIYPSVFEGFGIPVLEALWSNTPVITSNISCLPETGGDAAYYIDPYQPGQIAQAMAEISANEHLRISMQQKGLIHAQNFTPLKCAEKVMQVYLCL